MTQAESRAAEALIDWAVAPAPPLPQVAATGAVAAFVRSLGLPAERVLMAPYVVDNVFFSEGSRGSDRKSVRAAWGVPDDALVALFCGKLVPWKRP